jgi:hypothetical protein
MFSGIGRRMSSFIFGASPLQPTGAVSFKFNKLVFRQSLISLAGRHVGHLLFSFLFSDLKVVEFRYVKLGLLKISVKSKFF